MSIYPVSRMLNACKLNEIHALLISNFTILAISVLKQVQS